MQSKRGGTSDCRNGTHQVVLPGGREAPLEVQRDEAQLLVRGALDGHALGLDFVHAARVEFGREAAGEVGVLEHVLDVGASGLSLVHLDRVRQRNRFATASAVVAATHAEDLEPTGLQAQGGHGGGHEATLILSQIRLGRAHNGYDALHDLLRDGKGAAGDDNAFDDHGRVVDSEARGGEGKWVEVRGGNEGEEEVGVRER